MPTLTTHYSIPKPNVFGEDDQWGTILNKALDLIDATIFANVGGGGGADPTATHWKGAWNNSIAYSVSDLVRLENGVYVCILAHTGHSPTPQLANTWWVPLTNPLTYKGGWDGAVHYVVGDMVTYAGFSYTCLVDHINVKPIPFGGSGEWSNAHSLGTVWNGAYNGAFSYLRRQMVTYGGAVYICKLENGGVFGGAQLPTNATYWDLLIGAGTTLAFKGAWSGATNYVVNDVVTSGGNAYVCILNHINHVPPNGTYWVLYATAIGVINWRGVWDVATTYVINDAVSLNGASYICILGDTGDTPVPPNANTWWAPLSLKGDTGGAGAKGDQGIQGVPGPNFPVTISTSLPFGTGTVGQLWAQVEA